MTMTVSTRCRWCCRTRGYWIVISLLLLIQIVSGYPHDVEQINSGGKSLADSLVYHAAAGSSDNSGTADGYADDFETAADSSTYVNPYKYKFTLGVEPCSADTELLIIVHTSAASPIYSNRRILLRGTWLNKDYIEKSLGLKSRIIFFMGKPKTADYQSLVEYESEQYRDIVQSDFVDSYNHNTYKAMSFLLWTSKYCSHASLLMKIDDDVLLKTDTLPSLKKSMHSWIQSGTPLYIGKFLEAQVNRDPNSKWYVSRDVYPNETYPVWFQGLVYFLTPSCSAQLFQQSLQTRYMHTDDVFMGIVVHKVPAIRKGIIKKNNLSAFATANKDIEKKLAAFWLRGSIPFFHIPNPRIYILWATEDMRPKPDHWFRG